MQHNTKFFLSSTSRRSSDYWYWLGPLLFMIFVGIYFVSRYTGRWAEADSTTFTYVIRPFVEQGRLVPPEAEGAVYPNGFAFQAISAFIIGLTGLEVVQLQQLVYPLVAAIIVLPAWVLYRELTGSMRGATFTTLLLFTQPEFLFVVLRSSHEKFTRTFMLLCLFLLMRSFKVREQPWLLAIHIGLFYLLAFGFIASNNLLAHSFIFAVGLALAFGWILQKRSADLAVENSHVLPRLFYATLISLGLVYICTFYVYSPAIHNLAVMQSISDRIAALFLDVQETGGQQTTNSYTYIAISWISLYAYFMVSIANWIVLGISFCIWMYQGVCWLWQARTPSTQGARIVWLLYAAFAAQGAFSVVADASGALTSNLQHRLFPSFSMIAVALVGMALVQWRPRRAIIARSVQVGLFASMFCVAILSVFKATNEPLLSNKWTFYRASELTALDWADAHLQATDIWSGYDERLSVTFQNARGDSPNQNSIQGGGQLGIYTRSLLVSSVTRLRSSRLGIPLPLTPDALHVYDNGDAGIYRLRPETPYQK